MNDLFREEVGIRLEQVKSVLCAVTTACEDGGHHPINFIPALNLVLETVHDLIDALK